MTRFAPETPRSSLGGARKLTLATLATLATLSAPRVVYGADRAPATSPREEVGPVDTPPRLVLTAPIMAVANASERELDHTTRDRYLEDRRGFLSVLLAHGTASLALGATMLAGSRDPFAQGFGLQTLAWGAVNDTIALVGLATESSVARTLRTSEDVLAERRSMRRFLWVNVGLDALYVTCGSLLAGLGKSRFLQGNGAAILSQGAFLFVFDLSGSFWQGP